MNLLSKYAIHILSSLLNFENIEGLNRKKQAEHFSLELIVLLGRGNREGHADAAQDVVWVGLAVEDGLGLIVTL